MGEPELHTIPPKYSRRYLKMHLDKARDGFSQAARPEGISGFSPNDLGRVDAMLSNNIRESFAEAGCENPDLATLWFTYAIFGSYLGDVLVRNLGGQWMYPNPFITIFGLAFGRPDWIYRRWFVVVGKKRVPVFVIAMRRHTLGREKASLFKAYDELARTCGKPNQEKGASP